MSAPIVFLDTETTGLALTDDIWEFAAIRREDGTDLPLHLFIEHDEAKAEALPEKFLEDLRARFEPEYAVSRRDAARLIHRHLRPNGAGKAHVVGAVPNFDTERLALLLGEHGLAAPWHHHLICVEALTVGYAHGRAMGIATRNFSTVHRPDIPIPWSSDVLSEQIGITPPTDGRRTAMGDAEWVRAIWDRITGGVA